MGNQIRLDEVSVFGDKIRFLIPHEWVEGESEDGTYLYHAPETQSGWLRVSLITLKTDTLEERLRGMFSYSDYFRSEKQGNLVVRSEKQSQGNGSQIYIYYWQVGNMVPPNRVFQAVFSFTILAEKQEEPFLFAIPIRRSYSKARCFPVKEQRAFAGPAFSGPSSDTAPRKELVVVATFWRHTSRSF